MIQQTIQLKNVIQGNLENIDFLDLMIESTICTKKGCQQSEFHIGCPNCHLSNIKNFKYYLKTKLEYLKIQTIDYKIHFKKPCFNCSYIFHGSSFEDGHVNLQKMFEVDKECRSCQRMFTRERSFHHICNICNESFKNCKFLVQHRTTEHNMKKPHQCAGCHLSLSQGGVSNHIYKHTLPHVCPYCNKKCSTKWNLKLHIVSHTGEKPFSCKYCPKQYATKQNLDVHLFEHSGDKQFQCDLCDKTFGKRYLLNKHKSRHVEKIFQCQHCSKEYKSKLGLDLHLFVHTGGKCNLCDETFATQNMLNLHKLIHMEESFQCSYCPKKFKLKYNLEVHLLEHDGSSKEFKCDVCDKTFDNQYMLTQHKAIHIGKLFQCKYCLKQYKTKQGLDFHLFEHTGGAPQFKCNLCDKTFVTQRILNQHKFAHMVKKSFQCAVSSKFYKTPNAVRGHIRGAHKF